MKLCGINLPFDERTYAVCAAQMQFHSTAPSTKSSLYLALLTLSTHRPIENTKQKTATTTATRRPSWPSNRTTRRWALCWPPLARTATAERNELVNRTAVVRQPLLAAATPRTHRTAGYRAAPHRARVVHIKMWAIIAKHHRLQRRLEVDRLVVEEGVASRWHRRCLRICDGCPELYPNWRST